ncbi:unnamed protein product [Ixodes pacificus]
MVDVMDTLMTFLYIGGVQYKTGVFQRYSQFLEHWERVGQTWPALCRSSLEPSFCSPWQCSKRELQSHVSSTCRKKSKSS